jgi:pyruvate/2-oxoglutarate dehydrogenase complex dihydrolipoamide dehydrogenase (E3) component
MHPALLPQDEHNRRLGELVHPSGWINPRPRDRYHLVVIGAGTGGLVTAAIAAGLGARVALVERALMGGDCLNVGCVPSKALLAAGKGWRDARTAAARFGGPPAAGDGDFAAAMERMRRIRADIAPADSVRRFADELGVDVFLGEARFVADDAVEVEGARLRFHRAVVATGGRPSLPPIPGLADAPHLTHETVFSLAERPEHLAIVGGGAIGCELAQAFARMGTRVTVLEAEERILAAEDPDAAAVVAASLERDGVRIVTGAAITSVHREGERAVVRIGAGERGETISASHLLVAAGRRPNVEALDLARAGIEHDGDGIVTDPRMRTSAPRVYAIGDVASPLRFTHAADAQARMVVRNALFLGRARVSGLVVPRCTYTDPELAHVGPSARELWLGGEEVETITVPFAEVDRARLTGDDEGFLRIHLRSGSDHILAATVVGADAGELIAPVTMAMTAGIGLGRAGATILPYPTRAEALRKAADRWRRGRLTPLARGAFRAFFRVVGR